MERTFFILLLIFNVSSYCEGIIGFNCGTTIPSIASYSLMDTGDCDFHQVPVNSTSVNIELLQLAEFRAIHVIQCKIEIKRTVYHCGMFSHLGPTENGVQEYIYELSHEKCKYIHETGIFKYDNVHTISDLKVNSSKPVGIDLAGTVEGTSCTGASYADRYGSWSNVFVQGLIKITLLESFASVSLDNNKIRLNSGTVCKFNDQHCIDMEGGHTYWESLPTENCLKNKYNVLYRGPVTKLTAPGQETVYSISTKEISFALSAREDISFCNRILIKTEHPKLFIYENSKNNALLNEIKKDNEILNYDIFAYMNSKFVYVEKHFRSEVEQLYMNILKEKCELERQVLFNSLSIASLSPDEFAFNLMKKPGYIAKIAGEAVHIIPCIPVEVQLAHSDICYTQLPVTLGNQTWFLTPKTHILLKTGTQINCNPIIPHYYKIGDNWINLLPKPRKAHNHIQTLNPSTTLKWKPKEIENLAISGIYTQEDIQDFEKHIMFPMEKGPLLNTITRGMQGEENVQDGLITNLFSEKTLSHIAENTWNKIVEKFIKFGSISSGIIMILIILHCCKLAIDMAIRGYTLHAIYGWSLHVLGAIFSSLTHLLIVLNTNQNIKTEEQEIKQELELREIVVQRNSVPSRKAPTIELPMLPSIPPKLPSLPPAIEYQKKPRIPEPPKQHLIFSLEPRN